MMDSVQNCDSYINISSSQTYRRYQRKSCYTQIFGFPVEMRTEDLNNMSLEPFCYFSLNRKGCSLAYMYVKVREQSKVANSRPLTQFTQLVKHGSFSTISYLPGDAERGEVHGVAPD
jgi:hypothetical protein